MATCSSILAWEIPWTEKPGGLTWSHKRIRLNLATKQQQFMLLFIWLHWVLVVVCRIFFLFYVLFYLFIFKINLFIIIGITLQYCGGFCHTLT